MSYLTPLEVFEENLEDAHQLIELNAALANYRQRRLRHERRKSLGHALGYSRRVWDGLDCVESDRALILLKPEGGLTRESFTDEALRPLLRQAVVAIAAAVETYVLERSDDLVGDALSRDELPRRLCDLSITMGTVMEVERTYTGVDGATAAP